jgi:drug/metabolite transporter (DMT)-like permease
MVLMSVPYGQTVMTTNSRRDLAELASRRPALTAVLGAACISSSAVLVTLANVPAATTAFFRCILALPVLIPLAVLEQRRFGPRPLRGRRYAVLAGLFLSCDLVLWNHSISDVGAGVATVLGNLQVLFVAFLAWLVMHERPSRRYLVMLPVVLIGVVLVSGMVGGHGAGEHPVAGAGFGLATSAAYACFLLLMRSGGGSEPRVAGQLADATVGAAIGSAVLGLAFGGLKFDIGWPAFGWLLLLALLSGTIGWLLITSSLPKLPASVSSLLLLLQPAGTMVLAAAVLHEWPTLVQLVGAVVTCCGVLAVTWTRAGGNGRARAAGESAVAPMAPSAAARQPVSGLYAEQHIAVAEAGSGGVTA